MSIITEAQQLINNYSDESIEIIDGLIFNARDVIKKIEYYTNSRYINGQEDNQGRYKPFYNVVNFRVNVATRATDFDTKDFQVYSENPKHYVKSMLFSKEIRNWMKKTNFAKTLNEFGYTRAKYGGVLVKRVMKDGELTLQIPEWKNVVFDQADMNGTKAEKHFLTPIDIYNKKDVWDFVEENEDVIDKAFATDNGKDYGTSARVCVLEIEGIYPNEYIDEDEEGYSLQKHFVLMQSDEPVVCLHSEKRKESDYMYLDWLKASGRGLGIGVVEDGFEAQFATNDTILKQQDIMEAAAKIMFVHNSDEVSQIENISEVDFGHMFKIGREDDFRLLNQTPSSLPALDNIIQQWDDQLSKTTSTFEAITGETMPSGTPFRALAVQNQEAQSIFNYRKEEAGIFWRELFVKWVIPHIKKGLTREHILRSDFSDEELKMIDKAFTVKKANQYVIEQAINGKVTTPEDYQKLIDGQKELLNQGIRNERFVTIPEGYFKDAEFQIDVITTGEQINKGVMFETITNIINTVATNPAVLDDPRLSQLFAKVVELSGIGISPDVFLAKPEKTLQELTEVQQVPTETNEGTQPVL